MAGKAIRDIKLNGFSAIAAIVSGTLLLIGVWMFLGQILGSNPRSVMDVSLNSERKFAEVPQVSPPLNSPLPKPTSNSVSASDGASNDKQTVPANAARQGVLRVGNVSEHPVRVALLLKKVGPSKGNSRTDSSYEPPAHWDFAPGEGRAKGLLLSLPNRSVKVKKGDVLVAFAQDGSRRYWGPYVVGETTVPDWNATANEWELVLEP